MRVVDKAFAYITNSNRLLVFEHVGKPEAGIQVPAGSVRPGESLSLAAIREAREETGLIEFGNTHFLGIQKFDARPFGKNETHRRHFFHLSLPGDAADRWRWFENDPSDGSGNAIEFEHYWVSLEEAKMRLAYDHNALINELYTCCPAIR